MGQDVEIRAIAVMGDVLLVDTDRSFTGQDGQTITPGSGGTGVPARLAEGLFDLDLGIDHVFILQNSVTVRRPGGWDPDTSGQVESVTRGFLRHYEEDLDGSPPSPASPELPPLEGETGG